MEVEQVGQKVRASVTSVWMWDFGPSHQHQLYPHLQWRPLHLECLAAHLHPPLRRGEGRLLPLHLILMHLLHLMHLMNLKHLMHRLQPLHLMSSASFPPSPPLSHWEGRGYGEGEWGPPWTHFGGGREARHVS